MSKKEFVSDVTGEVWHRESSARWSSVIHHTGVVSEDFSSATKNGERITLAEGSEVFIDDIRGRIKPQYRVKDENGKIWFVPVGIIKVNESDAAAEEISDDTHSYQGGVRTDAQQSNAKY